MPYVASRLSDMSQTSLNSFVEQTTRHRCPNPLFGYQIQSIKSTSHIT